MVRHGVSMVGVCVGDVYVSTISIMGAWCKHDRGIVIGHYVIMIAAWRWRVRGIV